MSFLHFVLRSSRFYRDRLLVLVLMLVVAAGSATAQVDPGSDALTSDPLEALRSRLLASASSSTTIPLEGAVDEQSYVVGPGDYFTVSAALIGSSSAIIPVGADGRISLPEAGAIMVAGLHLSEARARMLQALESAFGATKVQVALSQPRQFYVHVAGAVPRPGRYLALPVSRVSTVLQLAFADTARAAVTNPAFQPGLRSVRVERQDGTTLSADVLRYLATGDTRHDPYLTDGDVIHVPGIDPNRGTVTVNGAVPFPGRYDLRPDDTLYDVLITAGASSGTDKAVRVLRRAPDGLEEMVFSLSDALGKDGKGQSIHALDQISIVQPNLLLGSASVEGWVQYPGTYAIVEGETTVPELIELAGGLRPGALVSAAALVRSPDPTLSPPRPGTDRRIPFQDQREFIRTDSTFLLQKLRLADLDYLSRLYATQELRLQNRVSMDLKTVLEGGHNAPVLQDGDRLSIPRDERTVLIFGAVNRPGYVPFDAGQSAAQYLDLAGGPDANAGDAFVIRAATGAALPAAGALIESGDVIFVDRLEAVASTPGAQQLVLLEKNAKRDARFRVIQALLSTVSTVGSVVALIITVRNR